jgi:hypothetical protein
MPYKHSCDPRLIKWFNQTVKSELTKQDLFNELQSCPKTNALNSKSCEPAVQCEEPLDNSELISCEPAAQWASPSFGSESSTEDENMVRILKYQQCNHEVDTGTKKKEMEEPKLGTTKRINPPEKRFKHHPAMVSPTQDLLVKQFSSKKVVRAFVRVTRT